MGGCRGRDEECVCVVVGVVWGVCVCDVVCGVMWGAL